MSKAVTRATIDDAVPYIYTREQADDIIASYPAHERDARSKGIPTLGSGRIFPIADDDISYDAGKQQFPRHFVWLGGIDFGWDHPTAAVHCCIDRDMDIFYVTKAYRKAEATPVIHTAAIKPWGDWFPWAWPHDGLQHDKQSGTQLAQAYRDNGLNLWAERSTFADGTSGVEAGLLEMLEAMQTGRFKVAAHLTEWWDEFRLYHRKDGRVVKEYDDLMAATRYAWMMRRHAKPKTQRTHAEPASYGAHGWMA